jgi:hypothetical protein
LSLGTRQKKEEEEEEEARAPLRVAAKRPLSFCLLPSSVA